jgi:hypothetical protein
MRTSLLFITGFVAVICTVSTPAMAWTQIPYFKDTKGLGLWAVVEHNKQAHDGLTFQRTASAEKQDFDYQLLIHAMYTSNERGVFMAMVHTNASGNAQKLISFYPIIGAARQD